MKFYPQHKQDLHHAISNSNLELSEFNFSKKRGRIVIQHTKSKAQFSYIQKLDKEIDVNTGQWKKQDLFELVSNDSKSTVDSWSMVVDSFTNFLTQLEQ